MGKRRQRPACRGRGFAALVAALGLVVLAGCAAQAATRSAARQTAPCGSSLLSLRGPQSPAPRPVSASPGAAIVADFGLFRRPAQPGDVPSARGLGRVRPDRWLAQFFELATYYPASIRRLAVGPVGTTYYVIPGFGGEAVRPTRCLPAAAHRELLVERQHRRSEPVACVVETGSIGSGAVGCDPFVAIDQQLEVFASTPGDGPVVQLVPDGVTSVRISYRVGAPIVAPVAGNALVFTPSPPDRHLRSLQHWLGVLDSKGAESGFCVRSSPRGRLRCHSPNPPRIQRRLDAQWRRAYRAYRRAATARAPVEVEWLDAAGAVVRTIGRPTPANVAATSVGDLRAPIGG